MLWLIYPFCFENCVTQWYYECVESLTVIDNLLLDDLQLSRLQLHQPVSTVSVFDTESKETNQLKIELERAKKEKNITSGLVTQMQKDMSNKVCLYLLYHGTV